MNAHECLPFTAMLVERARTPKDQDVWMVTVDGFTTQYRKGTGHRVTPGGKPHHMPHRCTVSDLEDFQNPQRSRTVDPTCQEVLAALASDAGCYLSARDIDDFASEFGYTKVSEALKAWEGCRDAAKFFQARKLAPADFQED